MFESFKNKIFINKKVTCEELFDLSTIQSIKEIQEELNLNNNKQQQQIWSLLRQKLKLENEKNLLIKERNKKLNDFNEIK